MTLSGTFPCWNCGKTVDLRRLSRQAVLRGRRPERGGPYYVFECPSCRTPIKVEKDLEGRRVVSPASGSSLHDGLDSFRAAPFVVLPFASAGGSPGARDGEPRARRPAGAGAGARGEEKPHRGGRPSGPAGDARRGPARETATADDPYGILGVPADAGKEVVEKAFREQAKRCHPDRFADLDDEFRALAHRKFIRLRQAYDAILTRFDRRESKRERKAGAEGRPG